MADFPVIDPEEFRTDTGISDFHSITTISLGELIEDEIFTWERVGWQDSAYSEAQYNRVCDAFEARFFTRDISITPVKMWLKRLRYKFVYELCPKYNPLYEQLENGEYNPLQHGGEYGRERRIASDFPETLLNGSDETYASSGEDKEYEIVKMDGNIAENYKLYVDEFRAIDARILDELECMFSCLYATNLNGL